MTETGPVADWRQLEARPGKQTPRALLSGSPDIVLPKHNLAIFVHGCFWHRHPGCKKATTPRTRAEFWAAKFERNIMRDSENEAALRVMGWRVLTIWECEARSTDTLVAKLMSALAATREVGKTNSAYDGNRR